MNSYIVRFCIPRCKDVKLWIRFLRCGVLPWYKSGNLILEKSEEDLEEIEGKFLFV